MLPCRGGRSLLVHLLLLQGKLGPGQESSEAVSLRPRRPDCGGGDGGGGGGGGVSVGGAPYQPVSSSPLPEFLASCHVTEHPLAKGRVGFPTPCSSVQPCDLLWLMG